MKSVHVGSDLVEIILETLSRRDDSQCVIHGGHFVLDSVKGRVTDHLHDGSEVDNPLIGNFLAFSQVSWELACTISAETGSKVMVMVNDWQFIQAGQEQDRRHGERALAAARAQYYRQTPKLTGKHWDLLVAKGLTKDSVLRYSEKCWMFSETRLRQALTASIKEVFRKGEAESRGLTEQYTPTGDPIINVASQLHGETCLLFCGSTSCSGEIVELLRDIYSRGMRTFINIYPRACLAPVTTGTVLGQQLFDLKGLSVLNAALPLGTRSQILASDALVDQYSF